MSAIASENVTTRAAMAASQAEIEAALERGRLGLQNQLDEVLHHIRHAPLRSPTDGLEPALVAYLEKGGLIHLCGFFQRCQVRSLRSLAAVPEFDMHELGLSPMQAARVAAAMDLKHPSCPLRLNSGGEFSAASEVALPPLPSLRLKPVLDPENMNPWLRKVLENPGEEIGLRQSLEVVQELIEAGAQQALKLSGLSTVMVLGVTGMKAVKNFVMRCR